MFDKPVIAPMPFPENEPNENSSLEELAAYALLKQDRIFARDKMNAADLWLMGQALHWAKEKVQHGEWERWWKAQGLKKTYVWQARKLHEKAATLDDLQELGVTEALLKFGVIAKKKKQEGTQAAGVKKNKDENAEAVPAGNMEEEKPTEAPEPNEDAEEQTEGPEPNGEDDGDPAAGDNQSSNGLAEEEKELKDHTLTPKSRAVAILNALEALLDDMIGDEETADKELANTFDQIIELAEAARQLNHDEHASCGGDEAPDKQ